MILSTSKRPKRLLTIEFDQGNYLLQETVKEEAELPREDTIWLTPEEIEKIVEFKRKMTGEIS